MRHDLGRFLASLQAGTGSAVRRILFVLTVTGLLVAGLAGCGGGSDDSGDDAEREDRGSEESGDDDTTSSSDVAWSYGDDPELDALWDDCEAGDDSACEELFLESEEGSEYEKFGDTCGGRTDGGGCPEEPTVGDDGTGDGEGTGDDGEGMTGGIDGVDALCGEALGAIGAVPVYGDSPEDFASEEVAVAQILYDLADEVEVQGATELAGAIEAYARSRSDLALAYEQGGMSEVDAAMSGVDAAAADLIDAATTAGAPSCADIAD